MEEKKIRLGDMLIQAEVITPSQLEEALAYQKKSGKRLGRILREKGLVTWQDLQKVLEKQLGIESINLKHTAVDPKVVRLLPENVARRHEVIPVKIINNNLYLAMADPLDQIALQDVRLLVQMPVQPLLGNREDILANLDRIFSQVTAAKAAADYSQNQNGIGGLDDVTLDINSAPIVRLVNSILENAIISGASDVHLEPNQNQMRVRIRIDGILREVLETSSKTHGAVSSRIKVMAGLDIAEKRLPQDGRILLNVDNREVDLRVSTMPTTYGEKIVLRILDRANFFVGKGNLGLSSADEERFDRLISKPYGIILVTGPTGSGKTTTLYSMLSELNDSTKNIITLEDPVEYDLEGINQTQINTKAGLTFAAALRSILRQDPDIIMIGEIRDGETAEIAARAALTGHLVLSTLHTNDAPSAVTRITDMGVPPFLLSSALLGVVAQRLVRRICSECEEPFPAGEREKMILGLPHDASWELKRGKGCDYCHGTGYRGRVGIFEVMEINKELRRLIDKQVATETIRAMALQQGMLTLYEDAKQKVLQGLTTIEEMLRVTYST
ncbi:ATPase, T2SS/T4P/T4SS family [Bacillota bacterium LX-D]|nr:ATPase, T2SS/T4P/T4SS family [Bacillota bacterium LX-D]